MRHIVLTHLDVDHAGGLPDFPDARVHVFAREHETMLDPPRRERRRYRQPLPGPIDPADAIRTFHQWIEEQAGRPVHSS